MAATVAAGFFSRRDASTKARAVSRMAHPIFRSYPRTKTPRDFIKIVIIRQSYP